MDSISNLPLLEIAGEDDSLLFDVSAATTAEVFSCSPLIPLRSNPPQTEGREGGAVDSENRSSSISDNTKKENADWNKQQKLSIEPQQMKKKKKGGYNLRKSLAWNRAFFTEEGVLNPVELSMISGTATPKNLEAIHEEEFVGSSIELQDIEENLFTHSLDAVPVNDKKIGLSPKPGALTKASLAPVSMAKRKMLSVNDTAGNGSKRNACPRRLPLASSSLIKPDTVRVPSKELKVTRLTSSKSDVSASATAARRGMLTTSSTSKRNQNAHPATNLQKHAGVKGLSKIPKSVSSNPKVSLADKCSVTRTLTKQDGKHLDNSVSETHPPSRMHQSQTETNKVSEACLPRGFSDTSEKRQQTQIQTTKLSGLRMPSPSLGFFSLAKAPSSHGQLHKSSKPCKPARSNIPKVPNVETNSVNEAILAHAPEIRPEIVKGTAKNCMEELCLLDLKSKPSIQGDNKHTSIEVEHKSICSEKISKQEKVENIFELVNIKRKEQGELYRSETASSVEDVVFPRHETKFLSMSLTQKKLEKRTDHPEVLSNGYQSVFQEPQSMNYHGMQRTSIIKGGISNVVHNSTGQDKDEQIKLLACDVLTSNESSVLQAKHDTSAKDGRLSAEFKEFNSFKTTLLNSCVTDFSETVSGEPIQDKDEQIKLLACDVLTSNESSVLQAKHDTSAKDGRLSAEFQEFNSFKTTLSNSSVTDFSEAVSGEPIQDKDEQIKLLACYVLTSNESSVLQAKHDTSAKDGRLSAEFKEFNSFKSTLSNSSVTDFSETVSGEPIQGVHFKNTEQVNGDAADFVTSGGDAQVHLLNGILSVDCRKNTESNLEAINQQLQGEQLKTSSAGIVGEISLSKENESHVNSCQLVCMTTLSSEGSPQKSILEINCPAESETKIAIIEDCQFPVDDQSDFIQTRPVLEGCEMVIGSKAQHYSTEAFEVDRMSEDCMAVSAPSCTTEVNNVSQESRPFHGNNLENIHFTYQLCPMVKADFDSSKKEMSTNNCCMISELQLRDEDSLRDASMHYDAPCDIPGNFEQYSKTSEMLYEGETLVLSLGHWLAQSDFSEVSEDFISKTVDSTGTGAEKSSVCLHHTLAQLVQEVDQTNREIESHVEDAQGKSFSENPVAYNCNSKHCLVTNEKFQLAENNNINENSHLIDFQRSGDVVVDSENVNNILHLDGDWLPTNIASSEEIKKTVEDAQVHFINENPAAYNCNSKHCHVNEKFPLGDEDSHICDSVVGVDSENINNIQHLDADWLPTNIYTSEHNISNHHIQAMPENKDGNVDVDEREELIHLDDSKEDCSDILPLVEFHLSDKVISSECNPSLEVSKDSFTDVVAWNSEENCYLRESSNFLASDNLTFNTRIPQVCEVNSLEASNFSDEAKTSIFEKNEFPNTDMQHQSKGSICFAVDSNKIFHLQKTEDKSKQEVPTVKPPPNAALFSDEWLSAIEAAGEKLNQNPPHGDWPETVSATACYTKLQLRDDGSSGDASMHYDGQCNIPGNFEQQSSMTTYSIANEMLCEDESLVLNHDHLVDQSDFSEVSENFISNTKGSIGGEDEKPSGHLQHTLLAQLVQEFDHTKREIGESYLEDIQVQSSTENPVAYNFSSKQRLVTDDKFSLADNNNVNEDSHLSDFQRPGAVVGVDPKTVDDILIVSADEIKKTNLSEGALDGRDIHKGEYNASNHHIQVMPESEVAKEGSSDIVPLVVVRLKDSENVDNILHLDGDWLPTNIASSEEIKKTNLPEDALEGCDIHSASNHHIQAMPENKDRNLDVDERTELLQMDDVRKGSSDILPLVENQLNHNVIISEEHCLNESSNLPSLDNPTFNTRTPLVRGVGSLNSTTFPDETETNIFEEDEFSNTDVQHQSKVNIYSADDSSKIIHLQESATKSKQEVPTMKPPPNAAPFSDEWLAAIEGAGEEILAMKSGAVQNSPPDKPQHEPGPWSPVRRKNQSIGPFDCTKHNIQHSSS